MGIAAQRGKLGDFYNVKLAIANVFGEQSDDDEQSWPRQVFQTASEKIESASLVAVTALTSCLSRSVLTSDSEDSLQSFLDLVLKGKGTQIFTHEMNSHYS